MLGCFNCTQRHRDTEFFLTMTMTMTMTGDEKRKTKDEGRKTKDEGRRTKDDDVLSPLIRGGSKAGLYFSRLAARNHTNLNKLNKIICTQSHRDTKG